MKLPQLPDLNSLNVDDKSTRKSTDNSKQVIKEENKVYEKEAPIKKEVKNKRPKIPKSQYDADGNPVLTVPGLNDVKLLDEIDKYFGTYEEGE